MKRVIITLLAACAILSPARALGRITEDFYLNNTPLSSADTEAIKLLPSTLRLEIKTGEAQELYAEVLPEGAEDELLWTLETYTGAVEIYPRGSRCTVLGISEGEELLSVSYGDEAVSVAVAVEKAPEVRMRSFEYEGESRAAVNSDGSVYRTLVRILITLGASLCFFAFFYAVKKKRSRM